MLAALLRHAADLALPPRCPGCGGIVGGEHRFCTGCWCQLRFLGPPWCATCQLPFAHPMVEGVRCAACRAAPPVHAGVLAAVAYGAVPRRLALRLKYAGRTAYADTAARMMRRHLPPCADLLVPVPLHRWRLWSRGYNQAALMAAALERLTAVPHSPDLVRRQRATVPLRGLGAAARGRVVQGAFALAPGAAATIERRHVVLVDDVYTSGATTDAVTLLLRRAGAGRVTILCWARVLPGLDGD